VNNSWPLVPLRELLKPVSRPEPVDPEKTYKILGAHWYSAGLYIKDVLPGSEIRADRVYRVEGGDFVYNRLFAWKGSFAVAAKEHTGCYVSNEFPCFSVNHDRADADYLWKYFSRSSAWDEALSLSTGGTPTSRNRLKEEKFLALKISLPPLPEQRLIVARIESLAAQIHEAHTLRQQAVEESDTVWERGAATLFDSLQQKSPTKTLGELVTIRGGGTPSKADPYYWEGQIPWITPKDMKVREIDDAIDHISARATEETAAKLINPGAVLVVVRGMILAHTFPSAVLRVPAAINQDMKGLISKDEILPEFLCSFFWANNFRILDLVEKSTHDTRKFQTNKLLDISVPVPSLSEQRRIVAELDALQAQMDALKKLQVETAAQLDALLPSILDQAFKGEL
jgi:type I restriction enzyme S subunit